MMKNSFYRTVLCIFLLTGASFTLTATRLFELKVVDKDYLMIHFKDGEVKFVDDGKGEGAYGHCSDPKNSYVVNYDLPLNLSEAIDPVTWTLSSDDDQNYGKMGKQPVEIHRKSKLNGHSQNEWDEVEFDYSYEHTMSHYIYLRLPNSMKQGAIYTLEINANSKSDTKSLSFTYDFLRNSSEAVHVNLVGYQANLSIKAADLYCWMGDGGARDYSSFEGNKLYLVDVERNREIEYGTIPGWKSTGPELRGKDFVRSKVWHADFSGFVRPGTYCLAIEGVGCSDTFEIKQDIYFGAFRVSTLGYFYMRIGQDNLDMDPVPRRPLYISGKDPEDCKIVLTTLHPMHPDWSELWKRGDIWNIMEVWKDYVVPGRRENPHAIGGHSDALDWDRHLAHVSNAWDMMLPFILTEGAAADDSLGLSPKETGNGIPDILDEARNEIDFWLSLRDGKGYSHGLTNADENNILYQAGTTAIAAWANAANCAMMAEAFRINRNEDLLNLYLDSAEVAYNYATQLPDQMLDTVYEFGMTHLRGRDLKMMAAAWLYNVTGNSDYEDVINEEAIFENDTTDPISYNHYNQLYAAAAYLHTERSVHYPELQSFMKASVVWAAQQKEANYAGQRPSRRSTDAESSFFHTTQNVHRTIVAHSVYTDPIVREALMDAIILEADWGLGRNPMNMIQMTTASTNLAVNRSVENCYTSGNDDGTPGLHPGHTPYMNLVDWDPRMTMGSPSSLTQYCYPDISEWPIGETYFNSQYVWPHGEFTPRQTMRGKMAIYGYLYGLSKMDVD